LLLEDRMYCNQQGYKCRN